MQNQLSRTVVHFASQHRDDYRPRETGGISKTLAATIRLAELGRHVDMWRFWRGVATGEAR